MAQLIDGKKISAESESVDTPLVSVTLDSLGHYYWTVITKDSTELLRTKVGDAWVPEAVDSVNSIFSSVTDYTDSLVVVLKDSTTRFVLPMQYTVTLTRENGTDFGGNLTLKKGEETRLLYVANGPNPSLALIPQGGYTATTETKSGLNYIRIKAPDAFTAPSGKVIAIFSFTVKNTTVTVMKTITIKQED